MKKTLNIKSKCGNTSPLAIVFVILLFFVWLVWFPFGLGEKLKDEYYKNSKDKTIVVGDSINYNQGASISFTNFIDNHTIELSKKYYKSGSKVFTYDIKQGAEIQLPDSKDKLLIQNINYDEKNITISVQN